MRRFFRWFGSFALVLCCLFYALPAGADLDVRSAILYDMRSGRELYAQNADRAIPPASLTKIMTMYVIMDQVNAGKFRLDETVKVSAWAAKQGGSRMHLKAGERVTLDRLLMGIAVSSGNDAAMAAAEHVAGSEKAFVRMMNEKAALLGMRNTVFVNPHGLPSEKQVTTARDMLTLSRSYIKSHPRALRYHQMTEINHRGSVTHNKNPLLKDCPGADGLKTGWVNASGYNLIATVRRGDTRLIGVVLGSANSRVRAREMRNLMEAGFKTVESKGKTKVSQTLDTPKKSAGKNVARKGKDA